jgi:hypothetical protein
LSWTQTWAVEAEPKMTPLMICTSEFWIGSITPNSPPVAWSFIFETVTSTRASRSEIAGTPVATLKNVEPDVSLPTSSSRPFPTNAPTSSPVVNVTVPASEPCWIVTTWLLRSTPIARLTACCQVLQAPAGLSSRPGASVYSASDLT